MRLSAMVISGIAAMAVAIDLRVPAQNAAPNSGYRLSTLGGNSMAVELMAFAGSALVFIATQPLAQRLGAPLNAPRSMKRATPPKYTNRGVRS